MFRTKKCPISFISRRKAVLWRSLETSAIHKQKQFVVNENGAFLNSSSDAPRELCFDDFENACKYKTNWELARSLLIFKICSSEFIVKNSFNIMNWNRKIFGKTLFNAVMRPTFYDQFVGGDSVKTILATVESMQRAGIGPLLAIPMEEDINEGDINADKKYDRNLKAVLDCMDLTTTLGDKYPMMQLKLTALLPADLCQTMSTIFPQPSQDPDAVLAIGNCLCSNKEITEVKGLSTSQIDDLNKGLKRLRDICKFAVENNVIVMVDAEYTYMNPCLNLLSLAMMLYSNGAKPLVFYTYQNYLKTTPTLLKNDIAFISGNGVGFASKLVRGAYIEKERRRAKEQGYEDPVCDTFDLTTQNYNQSMDIMLSNISGKPGKFNTIIASHNEGTVNRAVKRMKELDIPNKCDDRRVFFGQVYGMTDFISVSLGQAGYMIYKSIPYGSIEDTLPYLSRRVAENSTIFGGVRRERQLIKSAFKNRFRLLT